MPRAVLLPVFMIIMISVLVGLYHLFEPVQEWVVFTAIVATAMALRPGPQASGGTP